MAFVAGLLVGILGGTLSWIAVAAWLETRRAWENEDDAACRPTPVLHPRTLDRLSESLSQG